MKWVSSWTSTIVASVIIATIVEMILPEGKNKKYIKTVVGIFVLFSIIAPVITKINGENIDFISILTSNVEYENKNYERVLDTEESILETYKNKIKEEMISKIENKGFKVNSINLEINKSEEKYGTINKIELKVTKNEKIKSVEIVNKVEINIEQEKKEVEDIPKADTVKLKQYLEETYQVDKNNIIIN